MKATPPIRFVFTHFTWVRGLLVPCFPSNASLDGATMVLIRWLRGVVATGAILGGNRWVGVCVCVCVCVCGRSAKYLPWGNSSIAKVQHVATKCLKRKVNTIFGQHHIRSPMNRVPSVSSD